MTLSEECSKIQKKMEKEAEIGVFTGVKIIRGFYQFGVIKSVKSRITTKILFEPLSSYLLICLIVLFLGCYPS